MDDDHLHMDDRALPDRHLDQAMADYQILEYIAGMDKHQKRSLLNLVREGILTDECFIQVSTDSGPERVQVSTKFHECGQLFRFPCLE